MPYVVQDDRDELADPLYYLGEALGGLPDNKRDGGLNYVISTLVSQLYERNYRDLNAAIGVLECCKLELYRRVVAPYEDTKIIENGDVYT
jgi:hypothetical protein